MAAALLKFAIEMQKEQPQSPRSVEDIDLLCHEDPDIVIHGKRRCTGAAFLPTHRNGSPARGGRSHARGSRVATSTRRHNRVKRPSFSFRPFLTRCLLLCYRHCPFGISRSHESHVGQRTTQQIPPLVRARMAGSRTR